MNRAHIDSAVDDDEFKFNGYYFSRPFKTWKRDGNIFDKKRIEYDAIVYILSEIGNANIMCVQINYWLDFVGFQNGLQRLTIWV